MQLRRRPGLSALELGPQVLGQDLVEPVGRRTACERCDESILPGQRAQALCGSGHTGHRLGDRRFDDLEDRRPGEEGLVLVAKTRQQLGSEVVGDRRILAGHHHRRARWVDGPCADQRRQVDSRRPSFGPFVEHVDLVGRERTPCRGREPPCLVHVEGEIGRSDLEEVPARAEPGEVQVRLGAPRKSDLEAVRQVVDERDEGIEARPIDESVSVIEDEDGRLADLVNSRGKPRHRRRQET